MKKELPTIDQLKNGGKVWTGLKALLETEPLDEWLEEIEIKKKGENTEIIRSLRIERVEFLLMNIYNGHRLEILTSTSHQYSCHVTVRLHVLNPETKEWECQDGIGMSRSGEGDGAFGIAESMAKKSCAKKFGKIFGRDLSRKSKVIQEPQKEPEQVEIPNEEINHVKLGLTKQLNGLKNEKGLSNSIKAFKQRVEKEEVKINDSDISNLMVKALKRTMQNCKEPAKFSISIENFTSICELGFLEKNDKDINLLIKAKCLKYGIEFDLDNI